MKFKYYFSILLLTLCGPLSHAATESTLDLATRNIDLRVLSHHKQWLKLLHYAETKTGEYSSEVITPEFFISPTGYIDPELELLATLSEISLNSNLDSDTHAQCRFRDRYLWLKKQLTLNIPEAKCPSFHQWLENRNISSISLIFATGYFENPASFYGHMLLRFNSGQLKSENLLDLSINYGAIIPDKENQLAYIAKGLSGIYEAGFTSGSFYEHSHNYGDIELRDVWEYQLQLEPFEIDLIVAHSWTLLKHKFKYYYLTQNCAYRIVELIQLVTDDDLLTIKKPWIPPTDLIKNLIKYKHKNSELISRSTYLPSRQKRFYTKYLRLSDIQKRALKSSIHDQLILNKDSYTTLNTEEKVGVIDTLLDYYEIQLKNTNLANHKAAKKALLLEMLKLSKNKPVVPVSVNTPDAPEKSQHSSMLQIGFGEKDSHSLSSIAFRGAYFDLLNLDAGRTPYSQLFMLDVELQNSNQSTRINKLDVLHIKTFGLPQTGLPGDNRPSWSLRLGLDKPDLDCRDCLTPSLSGGYGKAFKPYKDLAINFNAKFRMAESTKDYGSAAAGAKLETIYSISRSQRAYFSYQRLEYIGSKSNTVESYSLEYRLGSQQFWDLRFKAKKAIAEELSVNLSYYF